MTQAREALKGKWGSAAVVYLILIVVSFGVGMIPVLGIIGQLLIAGPIALGTAMVYLSASKGGDIKPAGAFEGFNHFVNAFVAYVLVVLFTLLWTLLLIIPGIIASYAYAMTFFVLAENPDMPARDAIAKSKMLMKGNKWKLAFLSFRFIGWSILAVFTLGIGFLWLIPYMMVSFAKFYSDIKEVSATEAVSV